MATALRPRWKLCEVLPVAGMAKSGCEYARSAQAKGEAEGRAAARKAVIEASGAGGGTYGHRRVHAQVNADAGDGAAIGEWTVRSIMEEENLVARAARKKRRYSSYEGEISGAPENLLRDERGGHHFRSNKPNELRPSSASPPARRVSRPSWTASTACRRAGRYRPRPTPGWPTRRRSARASGSAGETVPRSTRTAAAIAAGRDG